MKDLVFKSELGQPTTDPTTSSSVRMENPNNLSDPLFPHLESEKAISNSKGNRNKRSRFPTTSTKTNFQSKNQDIMIMTNLTKHLSPFRNKSHYMRAN